MANRIGQYMSLEQSGALHMQDSATYRPNLAELMWAYRNNAQAWIADQIMPYYSVPDTKGQYRYMDEDSFFNIPDVKLDTRDYASETRWGDNFENYDLFARGHSVFLPDVDRDRAKSQYGSLSKWRMINAQFLAHIMKLDREKKAIDFISTSGNYANNTTLTGNDQWSSLNTSNPRKDVLTGHEAISKYGVRANTLVVGPEVYFYLKRHPNVSATITGGAKRSSAKEVGIIDDGVLKEYFEVDNFLVAWAVYNSTPEQTSVTRGYIMSDYAALLYVDEAAGGNEMLPTFAKTLIFDPQSNKATGGWQVKSVRDERAGGSGGEHLTAYYWAQEKGIASGLGYLIQDCLA